MKDDRFSQVYILTGPTGSGKSRLALELAPRLRAEIVAMDSMTLYRGMDIGTAKPTADERARVPHHLLDVLDPWESASVAWWLDKAAEVVRLIEQRGRRVLFVGGTALYLKSLLEGLFEGPPGDADLRRRLEVEAEQLGKQALHDRLAQVDPPTAARLHPNDVRRVIRALEVHSLTGQPISAWQTQWSQNRTSPAESQRFQCLDLPREVLYDRINRRVEEMIAQGWLDEVRRLRDLERPLSREASQALGYNELMAHLEGRCSLTEAVTTIQTRSRQFAKRQLTWFRNLPGCSMQPAEAIEQAWSHL
ncbi:MAG: tRNA (adenosine(37)-N6)-dimethylallyltransferase MiaA [Gemmataceae bacterium]